jgi:hypothetical protein
MTIREVGFDENDGRLRKTTISAGAMHPIEALIVAGPEVLEPLLYIDQANSFGAVGIRSMRGFIKATAQLRTFLPDSQGHHLLFVANRSHAAQGYENSISLFWRDAGACLQTFSLVSSATDYAFVPLGQLGEAILAELEAPHSDYVAVGTALIGKAPVQAGAPSS